LISANASANSTPIGQTPKITILSRLSVSGAGVICSKLSNIWFLIVMAS